MDATAPQEHADARVAVDRYEIYSRMGRMLDAKATLVEAERLLATRFDAQCIIGVAGSERWIVAERPELKH